MWQGNGIGSFAPFQPSFDTDDYNPSPHHNGNSRSSSVGPYSFQQQHPNQNFNNTAFMSNDFQDFGFYNEGAFLQNQAFNAGAQFSSPNINSQGPSTVDHPRVATQINARAAELKARLLKGREGRATSTPPVSATSIAPKPTTDLDDNSAPESKLVSTNTLAGNDQEININELISQYSEPKHALDTTTNSKDSQGGIETSNIPKNNIPIPGLSKPSESSASFNNTSNTQPLSNSKDNSGSPSKKNINGRPASSHSESDGEIIESPPKKTWTRKAPKKVQASSKPIFPDEQSASTPRGVEAVKFSSFRGVRDSSPPSRPSSNPRGTIYNGYDERRDEPQPRLGRKGLRAESINGRRSVNDPDSAPAPPRESRTHVEDHRRSEPRNGQPPQQGHTSDEDIFADLLTRNENLREWLEITGYHNAPYRDKILNRRRAIAALDAQREKLLAEMEEEERTAQPSAVPGLAPFPRMLPPPSAAKIPSRAVSTSTQESYPKPMSTSKAASAPKPAVPKQDSIPKPANAPQTVPQGPRVVSNKRPHSNMQENGDESRPKVARTEDRITTPRVKDEDHDAVRRPRSIGFDTSRRSSIDRERFDEREPYRPRYDETRGRRRDIRERSFSPAPRTLDSRVRNRSYGSASPEYYGRDRDDRDDRGSGSGRPFIVRGNYRGRAYDPSYSYRGGRGGSRGGGRADYQSHLDFRSEPSSLHHSGIKPYRDQESFNFGGRGDTRFFIVKSFNDTNVLRCMEDSIWTTQEQNGPIFTEAFEQCKNVILFFSINKSRAFQGYARMLTLPNSIPPPSWQSSIHWSTAGAFRVHWIVKGWIPFSRVGGLLNSLNENLPVLVGKDGQEVEEGCGRELCRVLGEEAEGEMGKELNGEGSERGVDTP